MPTIDIKPFKDVNNVDIINAIRNDASSDYRNRVPEASQARLQDNLQHLIDYRPAWNEFVESLINRIGLVIARNNAWTNPLAKFKRGMMNYGDTIEEIFVGILEAHTYNTDRDFLEKELFGQAPPDVQTSYHKITRQEFYKVTVNEPILRRAFIVDGDLSKFVVDTMTAPSTSDNLDEFLQTTALFAEYYRAGGFFKVQVDNIGASGSTAAQAKFFLRRVREFAGNLAFINTRYNAAGMPIAVNADELELFITPEAMAAIDVEALAAAFQIDKADINLRITVIPYQYFGIPGLQAILTTRDFFVIADTLIDTTSQYNAATLGNNFFLHHHEIISASRFVPAILFTTEEGTVVEIIDTPVVGLSDLTVYDESVDGVDTLVTQVLRGHIYQVSGYAITSPAGGDNDALRLAVSGNISTHTYVTQDGVLHVGIDEDSLAITVQAWAVDSDIPQLTKSVALTVAGDKASLWPDPHINLDADLDTLLEVTPKTLTMTTAGKVKIKSTEGAQYKVTVGTGVTFTDTGDIVTIPGHEASVGDIVSFGTITGTTGITAGTEYYVKTVPTADTMTLSATPGGATLALTTNGTAASATINVADGTTKTVPNPGTRVFSAVAKTGYELTAGATTSWSFTRP